MNGHDLDATQDEKFDLTMAIAEGSLRDVADIARRIEGFLVEV